MKNGLRLVTAATAIFLSCNTFACQFDTDCSVGSKCLKNGGSLYGACVGGLHPGNANDRRPAYNPLDLNRSSRGRSSGDARNGKRDANGTYGDTCSFDVDCGVGKKCLKGSGIYGTCT